MSGRTTIQLGVLVVILASGIYLLDEHLDRRRTERVQVQRVFDLTVDPVTAVGFERDGRRVEFVRKGNLWFLQSPMRARANAPLVERIVATLEGLRRQDRISVEHRGQRGLTLADYGLEPARSRITLETGDGRVEALVLGDRTPFGGSVYARAGRSDEVFTVPDAVFALFPDDLPFFRDRTVVYGAPESAERIDIHRRDAGFVRLVRQKSGWVLQQPLEARADAAAVRRLLESVFNLRVTAFRWDAEAADATDGETTARMEMALRGQIEAAGLAADAARLRLIVWTGDDRLGQEIFIGRAASDGEVFARKGGVDAVYSVPASILDVFAVPVDALRDRAVFHLSAGEIGLVSFQHGENRLELQRRRSASATGGEWRLLTPVRAPADTEAVNALIARLLGLRVVEYLPSAGGDPSPDQGHLLTIALAPAAQAAPGAAVEAASRENTSPPTELLLADSTPDGVTRLARTGARNEWFTLDAEATGTLDGTLVSPLRFRDRVALAVNTGTLYRVQRVTAAGTDWVERDTGTSPGEWRCGEKEAPDAGEERKIRPVDIMAVTDLLAAAARIEAGRFVAFMPLDLSPYGLDAPMASVTFGFRGADAIQNKLLLGSAADDAWRHAMVQGHDFVFLLSARTVERLLQPLCATQPPVNIRPETAESGVPAGAPDRAAEENQE